MTRIRNAIRGTKVKILALNGDAWGIVVYKKRLSGHVWYTVRIIDPGESDFEKDDKLDCRTHWLERR